MRTFIVDYMQCYLCRQTPIRFCGEISDEGGIISPPRVCIDGVVTKDKDTIFRLESVIQCPACMTAVSLDMRRSKSKAIGNCVVLFRHALTISDEILEAIEVPEPSFELRKGPEYPIFVLDTDSGSGNELMKLSQALRMELATVQKESVGIFNKS